MLHAPTLCRLVLVMLLLILLLQLMLLLLLRRPTTSISMMRHKGLDTLPLGGCATTHAGAEVTK